MSTHRYYQQLENSVTEQRLIFHEQVKRRNPKFLVIIECDLWEHSLCSSKRTLHFLQHYRVLFITWHAIAVSADSAHLTTARIRMNNCLVRQANIINSFFLFRNRPIIVESFKISIQLTFLCSVGFVNYMKRNLSVYI